MKALGSNFSENIMDGWKFSCFILDTLVLNLTRAQRDRGPAYVPCSVPPPFASHPIAAADEALGDVALLGVAAAAAAAGSCQRRIK